MDTDLIIIGAGAAGIGAAKAAVRLGLSHVVLEASHRIGGRAYTESPTPDIHFDLGCHWIHVASRNPFSQLVTPDGLEAAKYGWQPSFHAKGQWLGIDGAQRYLAFEQQAFNAMHNAVEAGQDPSVADVVNDDGEWAEFFNYWMSLLASTDPDQVAAADFMDFERTDNEADDWAIREGYGNLIAQRAAGTNVELNAPVNEIDSTGKATLVKTNRGDFSATAVLITVSTGVLNAGDIKFTPRLPDWKRQAIEDTPLGNHNRICLIYDRNVFGDYDLDIAVLLDGGDAPMYFEIRPFGLNYAVASTGGRFADWLERAGQEASVAYAREKLVQMFGSDAGKHIEKTVVTAWRGDPWVKGAYSAVRPGCHGARAKLAAVIDDRLFFAGEATSPNFMQTAHGAYISGVQSTLDVAQQLGRKRETKDGESLAWQLAKAGK